MPACTQLAAAGGHPGSDFLSAYAALAAVGEFPIPLAATYPLDDWRAAAELSLSEDPTARSC